MNEDPEPKDESPTEDASSDENPSHDEIYSYKGGFTGDKNVNKGVE